MITIQNQALFIQKEGEKMMKWSFVADEFGVFFFHTPVSVTQEDGLFYHNLEWLMRQEYSFQHPYCKKNDRCLVWLSDQSVDLEDEREVRRVNTMVIEKEGDSFVFSVHNPFLEELGRECKNSLICFSPCGNGYWSQNKDTGNYLQDEMIEVYQNTLQGKNMNQNKIYQKRRRSCGN